MRNVGLTEDLLHTIEQLRTSRQRLITAQDEERRKLERNLHDGAQQQIVALTVKLGLLERIAQGDQQVKMMGRHSSRRTRPTRSKTSATSRAVSTRPCWPTRGWSRRLSRRHASRRCR